jgi:hypothetical protein
MPPQLKQYLNRSILVSIPALYEDGRRRAYSAVRRQNSRLVEVTETGRPLRRGSINRSQSS